MTALGDAGSGIIDDGAHPGVDEPFDRWSTVVTYPEGHSHRFAGKTVRFRGDGSRRLALMRRDWHLANGATSAVVQRQTWTPGPWEDVT